MKINGKKIVDAIKSDVDDRSFDLEMRTRRSAIVGGVCGVEISAPEKISLRLTGQGEIVFIGRSLCCTSFGNRSVEIEGKIDSITFGADK